jgi:hypothetical protein
MDPKPVGLSPRSTVKGGPARQATTAAATTPVRAAAGTSRASRSAGQRAGCASPATSTPSTPVAPALTASRTACCRGRPTPTAFPSARPALTSPTTSTANAVTSKAATIAAAFAPVARFATTSTGYWAAHRATPHWSAWSTHSVPRTDLSRSSSGSVRRRSRPSFVASAMEPFR